MEEPQEELILKFRGIDDFHRAVYKAQNFNVYIGCIDILIDPKTFPKVKDINAYFRDNLDKLLIFGNSFNCEPLGTKISKKYNIKIIDND